MWLVFPRIIVLFWNCLLKQLISRLLLVPSWPKWLLAQVSLSMWFISDYVVSALSNVWVLFCGLVLFTYLALLFVCVTSLCILRWPITCETAFHEIMQQCMQGKMMKKRCFTTAFSTSHPLLWCHLFLVKFSHPVPHSQGHKPLEVHRKMTLLHSLLPLQV